MEKLKSNLMALGGCIILAGVVALLAIADSRMFVDADHSELYQSTLREAYNRFGESDRQVPAGAGAGLDPAAEAMAPPAPQAQMGGQGAANAAMLQQLQQLQQQMAAQQQGGAMPGASASMPQQPLMDDGGIHTKKGNDLLTNRQYDQAIAEFKLALAENPNRPLAQHHIGDALRYQGKHEEAIAAYEAVLKISPTYYCCHTHIGDILQTGLKNPQKAEEAFAKGVEGYRQQIKEGGPQGMIAKYHLSKFFIDHGRYQTEALLLAEQVNSEAPNQPMYLHLLAQCYEVVGRKQDAIATIDKALALKPSAPEGYQHYRQHLVGQAAPATQPAAEKPAP